MEISSPAPEEPSTTSRRKSGRVTKKPEKLVAASKRKRDSGDVEEHAEDASDSDSDEESDGEPDEEEVRAERRRARKPATAKAKQTKEPAKKRAKAVNGESVSLAIRSAKTAPRRKKPQKATVEDAEAVGGLYAEVFARDQSLDDTAGWWLGRFVDNENEAMADLFNFVLKCAGCDIKVEAFDVEDTDHYQGKLQDIQADFEAQGVYEYPLISRVKGMSTFRDNFTGTFNSLIRSMAKTNRLFENEEFNEVLSSWLATMSSAGSRPFRHTAVVASLSIMTALCQVGHDLLEVSGKTARQAAGEKKRGKGTQNKGRISDLDQKVNKAAAQREQIDSMLQAWFDTVFIHRYRDVDPRIRDECVRSLGQWIHLLPDKFFEGQYLRYLGWILSDSTTQTRHEVVKALRSLYNDQSKHSGLRTFTERFRERLVEMATNDSDKDVRADVIKLLDALREAGFLEPSDIDAVGRCIFETEPKIRKAVTPFLGETINELYAAKLDDLGGEESLAENLPNLGSDDDFESPRVEWIKLKSLAEVLQGYDAYDAEDGEFQRLGPSGNFILTSEQSEPRITLVAQSLYDGIPELHDWEVLAGLLLYDHSQTPAEDQNCTAEDLELQFKQAYKLTEEEEVLLLEVLNASVKMALLETVEAAADKKAKKTKAQKLEAQQQQEDAARQLALLIPRLFNKFGSAPEATSSILRLYHILNLEIFQNLARDVSEYEQLLEDIKKQFVTHANSRVLEEASQALLIARSHEELEEITDGKLQGLWENSVAALNTLVRDRDLSTRGNLAADVLSALASAVTKISKLSSITDSTEHLDQQAAVQKSKKKSQQEPNSGIKSILTIMDRGVPVADLDAQTNADEDAIVLQAAQVAKFYLMWKVKTARSFIESNGFAPHDVMIQLAEFRDEFQDKLITIIRRRKGADEVRFAMATTYLDVHFVYHALGNFRAKGKVSQTVRERIAAGEDIDIDLHTAMAMEVPRRMQNTLIQIFGTLERNYAKKGRKTLEEDVDDEPVDFDEDPIDEDEDAAHEAERKMLQALLAERKLCDFAGHLGLGIWAGVLDGEKQGLFDLDDSEDEQADEEDNDGQPAARKPKSKDTTGRRVGAVEERLKRNAKHLGQNFKQVVDKLVNDHPAAVKKDKRLPARKAAMEPPQRVKAPPKSNEIVVEDDDESEEDRDPIEDDEPAAEKDLAEEDVDADRETPASADEAESVVGD